MGSHIFLVNFLLNAAPGEETGSLKSRLERAPRFPSRPRGGAVGSAAGLGPRFRCSRHGGGAAARVSGMGRDGMGWDRRAGRGRRGRAAADAPCPAVSRRLACGDVEGRLDALFGRVRAVQGKSGSFDVRLGGHRDPAPRGACPGGHGRVPGGLGGGAGRGQAPLALPVVQGTAEGSVQPLVHDLGCSSCRLVVLKPPRPG